MDDNIITIGDADGFEGWRWKMTVDLKELTEASGRRDKKTKLIEVPIPKAKKLLKLIRVYGREEDLMKVDRWIEKNPKLAAFWETIR